MGNSQEFADENLRELDWKEDCYVEECPFEERVH